MKRVYLEFEGKQYDVGTKVLMKNIHYGVHEAIFVRGVENYFEFIPLTTEKWPLPKVNAEHGYFNGTLNIIKILEPIEPGSVYVDTRQRPMDWEIENAWIWYIIIMVGGTFFYDRWTIWIFATVYFILWKNGFLGGNK